MFRTLFYLIAVIVLITVLRMVIGIIVRGASQALRAGDAPRPSSQPGAAGGELKRDPVCGTYVAEAASIKRSAGGQVYYFCSRECSERFSR